MSILHENSDLKRLKGFFFEHFQDSISRQQIDEIYLESAKNLHRNGNLINYDNILSSVPSLPGNITDFLGVVKVQSHGFKVSQEENAAIMSSIDKFAPWRKGPFKIFNSFIESEWRSDFKWSRLKTAVGVIKNKTVLDIGSGNGYFAIKAWLDGAKAVVCLEPNLHHLSQFLFISRMSAMVPILMLPMRSDLNLPKLPLFDLVFSMGVLYHNRNPLRHLYDLSTALKVGGKCVLETLIYNSERKEIFVPTDRYAGMRNVWLLPSSSQVIDWLKLIGFSDVRCVIRQRTTSLEQKTTKHMQRKSLSDYLSDVDSSITIEGYNAPMRAIFVCRRSA